MVSTILSASSDNITPDELEVTWYDEDGDAEYTDEDVYDGDTAEIVFKPEAGYEIREVIYNGENVTSSVKDNKLTIVAGTEDTEILVGFRRVYNVIVQSSPRRNSLRSKP